MANKENNSNAKVFALLTTLAGSLTLGELRLFPFTPVEVPADFAEKVDTEANPVKFFESRDAAQAAADKLKPQAETKAKGR